jgi:hypothetical protein
MKTLRRSKSLRSRVTQRENPCHVEPRSQARKPVSHSDRALASAATRPAPCALPSAALRAFNPALPVDGSLIVAGELRDQFNGLASMIAAIPPGVNSAQVDGVTTLPPDTPATAYAAVAGSTLHLEFGIPQGYEGPQGEQGPPGDVSTQQMESAIYQAIQYTASNANGVSPLDINISDPPTQSEVWQVLAKINELIGVLYRTP